MWDHFQPTTNIGGILKSEGCSQTALNPPISATDLLLSSRKRHKKAARFNRVLAAFFPVKPLRSPKNGLNNTFQTK